MEIVLVNGRFESTKKYSEPLGIAYLTSVLRDDGFEVLLVDPMIQGMSPKQCTKLVIDCAPYLIGISSLGFERRNDVFDFIRELRKNGIRSHICVGGRDPSMSFSEYLKNGLADSVVVGEGELTFLELARALKYGKDWKNIKGLCYVENGDIVRRLPGRRIENPNEIPFPARDLLRLFLEKNPYHDSAQILGSRGCYGNCSFCLSPSFDRLHGKRKVRFRDVLNIAEEMRSINDNFGIKRFEFVDDVFLLPGAAGARRAKEFKELLGNDPRKMTFEVQTRPETIQEDVIMDLKNAGLTKIFVGIESFEDRSLEIFRKGCNSEVNDRALKCLSSIGFKTELNAKYRVRFGMITFHAETTLRTLEVQLEAAKRWGLSPKRLRHRVWPFEGTKIRQRYKKKGLLAGTAFGNPGWKFENNDVETFFRLWRSFIDPLVELRDRIRTVEKLWNHLDIVKDEELVQARKYLDSMGLKVFEQMLDKVKRGKSENCLSSFLKSQQEVYEEYWRNRVLMLLRRHEQLLGIEEIVDHETSHEL